MTASLLLTVAGLWVLTQVLAGNALGRLGIAGAPSSNAHIKALPKKVA